ncbi:MAG: hypothetical protein RMX68_008010 [Aulosira sp. ZfuVER01]|nr:hypothetical protein [Aulosira sp. ZfuVER01]MDZ7998967.1 hypothetical protein [Aulosira sp. DedVER01a]MDZ8053707.1 hypothetical protein [Aulosira sp. ZfuCHP01]
MLFGTCPCTIQLPAASRNEQLSFLRERIILHANNLVDYGLWDEYLTDAELDEIMADVEIEPVYFSGFSRTLLSGRILNKIFKKISRKLKNK